MAMKPALGLLAILFAVAAYFAMPARTQEKAIPFVVPAHLDHRLLELDREAIEEAYKHHVRALFASWMKDETGQPKRAALGIERARRAYVGSIASIERREERQ
jgi:hypothetical protein